jgi:hypothetical protein
MTADGEVYRQSPGTGAGANHGKVGAVPEWKMEDHVAAPPPQSPATTSQPEQTLTLVPYAAAKLRITAFPELKRG